MSTRFMRFSESVESPIVRMFQPRQLRAERPGSSVQLDAVTSILP